ncbi:rhomboid family intramembrane serine protease [Cytobacillus sp. Hz8]|uniref:rhomboid family intramembrane serine protease n=1 Tax=Cytobacillus sp. Hz8 TaxID=3347168 RepID=UPI0035D5C8EC
MFTRTETFKEFIRLYPIVTLIILLHFLLYMVTITPIFPNSWIFEKFMGVNLYIREGELWRLVTPIFLHSGFSHMLFNSFSLLLFGPGLERILGKATFLFLYVTTGLIANIATLILQPLPYTHVGSSGAIFGLFGIYVAIVIFRKDLLSRENAQIILTITIIGVIMTFFQHNINITGHIFGLLSGFTLGRLYLGKSGNPSFSFPTITKGRFIKKPVGPFSLKWILVVIILFLAIIGLLSK